MGADRDNRRRWGLALVVPALVLIVVGLLVDALAVILVGAALAMPAIYLLGASPSRS